MGVEWKEIADPEVLREAINNAKNSQLRNNASLIGARVREVLSGDENARERREFLQKIRSVAPGRLI